MKNIDAVTVGEAWWNMWCRVGIPEIILSDQGTQFMSECLQEVHRLLGTKGISTTPYHAQANGLVERYNGTLKLMLKKLAAEKPKTWDRYIQALLFAYREVPQESTGYSPFELLYGRSVRGPMTVLRDLWTEREEAEQKLMNSHRYVLDLRNRIEETCKLAQKELESKAVQYKQHFDRKAKVRQFEVGSKVLLLLPHKTNKLEMSWQGPFSVLERVGMSNYKIQVKGKDKMFHANMLKQYMERPTEVKAVAVVNQDDPNDWEEVRTSKEEIPVIPLQQSETVADVKWGPVQAVVGPLKEKFEEKRRILTDLPLRVSLEKCVIPLTSDQPVKRKQYALPYVKREAIGKDVDQMLKMDVIRRSSSAYSAPIVLVVKSDGTYRFCTDFRELNKLIELQAEPMPDVDYLFSKLQSAKIFSKIDLCKGYWQIEIDESDRHKTAFTTPQGCFEWNVMPFGLKTAGAIFSRMMRKVLLPLKDPDMDNFIDDIIIGSETPEEHVESVSALLDRMDEVNLAARPSKCEIGFEKIEYLGHVVGQGELRPLEKKVDKIRDLEQPKTKKQVRAFLGLAGYYRRFVPNFSKIAKPLTDATKKFEPNDIRWDEPKQQAFNTLKELLSKDPVVVLPDMNREFVVRSDASDEGLGALLMQPDNEKTLKIVSCASRKLKGAETRYSVIEKECLAIVWAVKKFAQYLHGQRFTVQSDHEPLKYLQGMKATSSRLMRWALVLQPYDIHIEAIPGSENCGADLLSRVGFESEQQTCAAFMGIERE